MGKITFEKPGNFLYPVPVVMVSCADKKGNKNILTIAWAGTICSDPPMVSISVRKERHSFPMIMETGEFTINLITKELAQACDYCGCTTGAKIDKFEACHLTAEAGEAVQSPAIGESPVNLECRVTEVKELGTHTMFLAEVLNVRVDESFLDENGAFHLERADLVAYSHGRYHELGETLGTFGYSVRKKEA